MELPRSSDRFPTGSGPDVSTRGIPVLGWLAVLLAAVALEAGTSALAGGEQAGSTLVARAVLPADTFAAGPRSGTRLGTAPINGRTPPFRSQPVQGFSAILRAGGGAYWVMADNGFGSKANSADFLLRVYRIRPRFKTRNGGPGTVQVLSFLQLRDPGRKVPFAIVNGAAAGRRLTGADFDLESFRRDRRGRLWFGDEYGPWLLHTDRSGRMLEAPIGLPGVKSPANQTLRAGERANVEAGFEGLAIDPGGRTLYPMLERALTTDGDQNRRLIYQFDVARRRYTGRRWQYRVEAPGHSIGDLAALDRNRLLVIERDGAQGPAARFKKIYLVDLRRVDGGFLVKREVADLLSIRDPSRISQPARPGDFGIGDPFRLPFQTIETLLPLDVRRLLVVNDNNYPFSAGRNAGRPDDNEFVTLELNEPLIRDADRDGIDDPDDRCPRSAAGRFDRNRNGCPGPYGRIGRLDPRSTADVSGRSIRFVGLRVENLPRGGATVVIRHRSRSERIEARGPRAQSRLLVGRVLSAGETVVIQATKPGFIGYWGQFRLHTSSPLLRQVRRLCIPASGRPRPTPCSRVSRGR